MLRLSVCVYVCVCTDLPGRSQTPPPPSPFHQVSCFPPRRPPAAAAVETLPATSWKHRKVFFNPPAEKKKNCTSKLQSTAGDHQPIKAAALNPVFQPGSKEGKRPSALQAVQMGSTDAVKKSSNLFIFLSKFSQQGRVPFLDSPDLRLRLISRAPRPSGCWLFPHLQKAITICRVSYSQIRVSSSAQRAPRRRFALIILRVWE